MICQGKVPYRTEADAYTAINGVLQNRRTNRGQGADWNCFTVYRCPFCGNHHLTKAQHDTGPLGGDHG